MLILRWLLFVVVVIAQLPQVVEAERVVLFLGDSLTAGLGVEPEESYPSLLGEMLINDGLVGFRLVNGGVSGSTSASALSRLQWYDRIRPSVLFLALGANDGLRGFTTEAMHRNLSAVIVAAKERGMSVLLAGMELPPNYGDQYTKSFRQVYRDLAHEHQLDSIPFLLEGVAGRAALNQADGIHPNAEGHRRIARHLYPFLKQHLLQLLQLPDPENNQP